jgi:CubicO group peptidase (beta-lactamase class C family)
MKPPRDTLMVERLRLEGTPLSKDITVYHLLTHTSGIGDDVEEEASERYEDLWKAKPNYSVVETRGFLPRFVNKPPASLSDRDAAIAVAALFSWVS